MAIKNTRILRVLPPIADAPRAQLGIAVVILISISVGCRQSPAAPSPLSDRAASSAVPHAADDLTTPATPATYYVATNERGADNDRCDGRSPVDAGNGRCPFKDFRSARTFRLLNNVAGVRVEVRAGTYSFVNEGLTIHGTGTSYADALGLSAYRGEPVVFDGGNALRELIRISGQYVGVKGLTLQHAAGYNLEVGGAQHVVIEGNRFLANGSSDSLKGDNGSSDVIVRANEFTAWDSQAIDLTTVSGWTVTGNSFHDPRGQNANAVTVKFGSRAVDIVGNRFRNTRGLALGAVASSHNDSYEAFDVTAERNVFEYVSGAAVTFFSCSGCQFRYNDISAAGGGIVLAGIAMEGPGGCVGGCGPNINIVVEGNRFRGLNGGPEGGANLFWGVELGEDRGLNSSANLYCRSTAAVDARFWYAGQQLTFLNWTRAVRTDTTSSVATMSDTRCVAW